jgi:hypothetical protein
MHSSGFGQPWKFRDDARHGSLEACLVPHVREWDVVTRGIATSRTCRPMHKWFDHHEERLFRILVYGKSWLGRIWRLARE